MKGMIAVKDFGGYEFPPSFKVYGLKIADPPDGPFEITAKVQITRQDTPIDGEPCVEFTVLEIDPGEGVDMEEMDFEEKMDSGDSLAMGLEKAAKKKAGYDEEGEEA